MTFPDPARIRMALRLALFLVLPLGSSTNAEPPDKVETTDQTDVDDGTFAMSPFVICSQINGYEDYEERADSTLTKDEKLLLYCRPRHFKSEKVGKKYQTTFTEDLRIRRKGQKLAFYSKDNFAEFKHSSTERPEVFYLRTSVSLKNLKPGDYELDFILHDQVGKSAPAKRSVAIKIVDSSYKPTDDEEPKRSSERPGSR